MKCPVCGHENKTMRCPECGFDASRDYGAYPTFGPVKKVPSVSALRQEWQRKQTPTDPPPPEPPKKKLWLVIAACIVVLALGIGIGVGLGSGKPEPMEPPQHNVLMSDEAPFFYDGDLLCVFGSEYLRNQIKSITFVDTLADMPADAWDVSEAGNGSVMAWVTPSGELYDLYIGGEGSVWAPESCHEMFMHYVNVERITFGDVLHTDSTQDMKYMFSSCESLTDIDLENFNTANVTDMSYMFDCCSALRELELGSFNTSNVVMMNNMFQYCSSLRRLDLTSFHTANVQNMKYMFQGCNSLRNLNLSSFDTTGVQDMNRMFLSCNNLTVLFLSEQFVTTNANTTNMFFNCPAGSDWGHLVH